MTRLLLLLLWLMLMVTSWPAHAFTCEQVINAQKTWSQDAINFAMKFASKEDIAKGKACLNQKGGGLSVSTSSPHSTPAPVKGRKPVRVKGRKPVVKQVQAPAPKKAPICWVEGDSIALGTHDAEGLPASYKLVECSVDAKIGIPSSEIIGRAHDAMLVVISAGSNDPQNPKLSDNLEAIRTVAKNKVLWIVPAISPTAAAAVKKVAAEHHDDTVEFVAGKDHTHPLTYKPIISQVRADLAQLAQTATAPAPVVTQPEDTSMPSWLIPVFAVFGALAFTYAVGKYGLVPVKNKLVSWWNSGKADIAGLEARVKALESRLGVVSTPAVPPPNPGATGPA